ncbi:peptidoglycan-binding protein [Rhodobacteraceae bacterium CCMM004]|nr:peptidoglycan-binding protein [Rhodobacteraceae bacterium CCMM004]
MIGDDPVILRLTLTGLVSAALLTAQTAPVRADAGDFIAGAIVGAIVNHSAKQQPRRVYKKKTYVAKKKTYRPSIPATQEGRQIQTSLNYFGFNAGSVDGQLGRKSKAAVSAYQAFMNYPVTGQLTDFEKDFLFDSYYKATANSAVTASLIAQSPHGAKGLLLVYRDDLTGGTTAIAGHYGLPAVIAASVNEIAKSSDPSAEQLVQRSGFIQLSDINGDGQTDYVIDTSVTGSAFWCNAQSCAVRVFASTPEGYQRNDFQAFNVTPAMFACVRGNCTKTEGGTQLAAVHVAPAPAPGLPQVIEAAAPAMPVPSAQPVVANPQAAVAAAPALPTFLGGGGAETSLASHCNKVSLVTNSNGGFTRVASMSDPDFALSEQFCLARTYAIETSEEMIASIQGFTSDQIAQQCRGLAPAMQTQVAALSLKGQDEVTREVAAFILSAGMSPAQLKGTARICLGVGYRTDDMDVALASSLLLYALGQEVYGEILGHHLHEGIGTAQRTDAAMTWYAKGLSALESGAEPAFAPGQPERLGLLQAAVAAVAGGGAVAAPIPAAAPAAGLPTFALSD